ncbi:MAG: AAA family ATPase, partial [Pyramidobacter sp.]|nr:AAA family ATPase [Pyramidobacter sp.]
MRIAQTRIRNFRNLENALCEWHPGLNVLSGPNGAGKTNVLEALHIITGWGAFCPSRCSDTVRWNSEGGASLAAQAEGERSALIEAHI